MSPTGEVEHLSVIEADADESMAIRFTKLFNNQVPHDMRKRVMYNHQAVRVA